jgi:hypothetical protein
MPIGHAQVTVTTSATLLHAADEDGAFLHIKSEDAIFLGNGDVTINNGYLLDADFNFPLFVGPEEQLYGIKETESTTVYVLMTLNN